MPELELKTPEGVTLRLDLAGAGSRFGAASLDVLVVGTALVAGLLLLQLAAELDPTGLSAFAQGFLALGALLVLVAYNVYFHAVGEGQTPGKRLFGLRVVGVDGEPASTSQHLMRAVVGLVDTLVLVPVPLGVLVMATSERWQRLGDMVAGTVVVREARRRATAEPWPKEDWRGLTQRQLDLTPAVAGRFDADDFDLLRDVLGRRGIDPRRRLELYERVAAYLLARAQIAPIADPRVALKELYLFLREERGSTRSAS